jgi:hypothetical protein
MEKNKAYIHLARKEYDRESPPPFFFPSFLPSFFFNDNDNDNDNNNNNNSKSTQQRV